MSLRMPAIARRLVPAPTDGCPRRVPLDVQSLEFVSAVVADKCFDSSNHSNSVLQVQRCRKDVSKDVRGKNIFTSHRKIFTHPMSVLSNAPSHTIARSSLFITCRIRASLFLQHFLAH